MKLTVDAKTFVDAIQWATKSFDGKNDRAFVALSVTKKGEAFLAHSNSTSYMKRYFTVVETELEEDELVIALEGRFMQVLPSAIDTSEPL